MSSFLDDMSTAYADMETAFGESEAATLRPRVGAVIEDVTVILGAERTEVDTNTGGIVLIRRRTCSADPSVAVNENGEVMGRGWEVTVDGITWAVVATESRTDATVRVILERPEVQEISRQGYRR